MSDWEAVDQREADQVKAKPRDMEQGATDQGMTDQGVTDEGVTDEGVIVVLGSANEDYVVRVGRRPSPGETVGEAVLDRMPGGKGANQAVAAARLGANVEIVAKVGTDSSGDLIAASLEESGVGCRWLYRTRQHPSGAAFITVTPDGENTIVVAPGANAQLSVADVDAARASLHGAAVVVMQLEIPVETVHHALEACGGDTLVVLNASPERHLDRRLLSRVDLVVVNQHEAAALVRRSGRVTGPQGRAGPPGEVPEVVADAAMAGGVVVRPAEAQGMAPVPAGPGEGRPAGTAARDPAVEEATWDAVRICEKGPSATVVTLGPCGSVAAVRDTAPDGATSHWTCHVPAGAAPQVVDTTGAGDAFTGALVAWLVAAGTDRSSASLRCRLCQGMEAAAAVAAVAVSRPGSQASFPSRSEAGLPWA